MKNILFGCLLGAGVFYLSGCQLSSGSQAAGWTVDFQPYYARHCIDQQQCAEVNIRLPVFKGSESTTLGAFNEKVQRHLLVVLEAPTNQPIEAALDSVASKFFNQYAEFKKFNTPVSGNWRLELISNVPVLNSKIATIEARQLIHVLFDHKTEFTHLITYHFETEKYLGATDLIADTVRFRPILEAAFMDARELKKAADIKALLLPTLDRLPMPRYIAVYPGGLRIVYNQQEISHLQIPVTDFQLGWAELGDLVDKNKWLE